MRDDHAHLWLLSSVLSSNALTLFSPHPLLPTYLLTEPNRQGFISVLRLVFNWVFLKVVSMDQIDMIFTAVVSILTLHFFIFCPSKLRQIKILKIILTGVRSNKIWLPKNHGHYLIVSPLHGHGEVANENSLILPRTLSIVGALVLLKRRAGKKSASSAFRLA